MKGVEKKRLTRREAIRKFCIECMGGSWSEVRLCTAPDCPLYRYRMGNENKALAGETGRKDER